MVLERNYSMALRRQHIIMTMWHLKLLNPVLEFLLGDDWRVHKTSLSWKPYSMNHTEKINKKARKTNI